METKSEFIKPKIISLAKQSNMISTDYENFSVNITASGKLIAIGDITPTPLSREYTVKIEYTIGSQPKIEIINPAMEIETKKIPHVYKGNRLCLFYPKYKEWTKYDYISEKIIPWITLWLYYYEIWNITGEWRGEGIHPNQ